MEKKLLALIVVFLFFCTSVSLSSGNYLSITNKNDKNRKSVNIIDEHFEGTWIPDQDGDAYLVPNDAIYGAWDIDGLCLHCVVGYPQICFFINQMKDYGGYGLPYDGTYCAGAWWSGGSYDPIQDEWLKTPDLNLQKVSNLSLSFYGIWNWDSNYDDHVYIKVSTNGGFNWTILADLLQDPEYEVGTGGPAGTGWCWNDYQVVINLSDYDHEPSVIIAYHLKGDPTMGGINFIDAFVLSGNIQNYEPFAQYNYTPVQPVVDEIIVFSDDSYDLYGNIVEWDWDFDDGYTSTQENPLHAYSNSGRYYVTLTVKDDENETDTHGKIIPVGLDLMYIMELEKGWNFVSIPHNISINKVDILLKNDDYFYGVNDGLISKYLFGWDRQNQFYTFTDNINPGYGYWIFAYEECELWFENVTIDVDDYITTLEKGWNIVGTPFNQSVNKMFLYVNGTHWNTAVTTGLISNFVFGWDTISQSYMFSDSFEPTQAYWLYAYYDCILER